jgi:uncharacterized protein (DUF362 family)
MTEMINRRDFFRKSIGAGLTLAAGSPVLARLTETTPLAQAKVPVDVAAVSGSDYLKNTIKAVEILGGMKAFVPKGSKVALLPNVQSRNPGTFTKPEILRAVVRMCREAGAKEVNILSWQPMKSWEDCGLAKPAAEEGAALKLFELKEENFKKVPVPDGKNIREVMILNELDQNDVLINLPVTKDHAGNKFTGTLKNMMGLNSRPSNRTFHKENWTSDTSAIEFLDQCIVDLNKVLKPTLNIVDATEFIITNGPMGPGDLHKPQKVVAGVDRVAVDSYCCTLWGLKAENIFMIKRADTQGLGRMNLASLKIQEVKI